MERSPKETWDGMLPGPPSRSNGGAADLSFSGLLAYATGCSVAVVDSRSMQLVSVVPLPPPSSPGVSSSSSSASSASSLSPYVTSVRWSPQSIRRDILSHDPSSTSHLLLAAGDRQGRIALLDLRKTTPILFLESENSKAGIQDLCWIQDRHDSWIIAALSGPSFLSLYDVSTGRCFFKYDASPELFSCIRLDPFDSRHFCVLGLKGFLLSIVVLGQTENDVVVKELKVNTDCSELQKLEAAASGGSGTSTSTSPALAVLPTYLVRFAFSPHWRNILFVTFPRELVVFDSQYETALAVATLPRGFAKFLDVVPDPNLELLYCVHLDGKLSTWRRKEDGQVHIMCTMEELVPSIGTSVPSPSVLVVALSQIDSTFHNIVKQNSGYFLGSVDGDFDSPLNFDDDSLFTSKTRLLCITDDGKIWNWILTAQGPYDAKKNMSSADDDSDVVPVLEKKLSSVVLSGDQFAIDASKSPDNLNTISTGSQIFTARLDEMSFKINLSGQLSLLSSTVTMLAVPSPSLTATLGRGGNDPAAAVPLVALGTQSGVIDVIDVSANAVAASFAVHSTTVRGLRWLGNSKLVSFSYIEGNERTGGFTNKLIVTCLRSGINRPFRVFQKPERTPIRALRTSSSGRYLLILFRDAPVEVWVMTKTPVMLCHIQSEIDRTLLVFLPWHLKKIFSSGLKCGGCGRTMYELRSLALPFTVLEWTLPTVPRPTQSGPTRQWPLTSKHQTSAAPTEVSSPKEASSTGSKDSSSDGSQETFSETFAFALANGALGVFEVQGRKIRDFRPKWPASSFAITEGLITAMAYRIPHVVMGDRSGSIRWWDVTTGQSSSFNTHKDGIRRIKFSPVVPGDRSRGRIAVLFYDNTFSVFDLDSPDPLANSLLQPQFPGTLVLELDWLPLRMDKNDPLVLCIAGADSSFRMFEININESRPGGGTQSRSLKERYRPTPLCCPVLLPTPHALALRMILQLGVKPAWFNSISTGLHNSHSKIQDIPPISDLRDYMIDPPPIGDSAAPEMLLKVLEPYRKEGCIFDVEKTRVYASIVDKGCTARFAFAAATFGDSAEALFWFKLHDALNHLMKKLANKSSQKASVPAPAPEQDDTSLLNWITLKGKSTSFTRKRDPCNDGQLALMAFGREDLLGRANERISWHDKLGDDEAIQNRVHELVSVGNFEMAVSLLLSTHPESSYFYPNALRAVALSAAVSRSLLELAVKVVAANMVGSDRSMSGTHLLCAVGRYQEACSQLQDAGCWDDAATLAATYLTGSDYIRVMQRWAAHVLHAEHNIWRALILYVEAGALPDVLTALRDAQQPDTAAMFILACREIYSDFVSNLALTEEATSPSSPRDKSFILPGLDPEKEEVIAVGEYFGQYQRKLIHLCMDSHPFSD